MFFYLADRYFIEWSQFYISLGFTAIVVVYYCNRLHKNDDMIYKLRII